MPVIDYGSMNSASNRKRAALSDVHYDYAYPDGLDWRPGSELHDKIRDELKRRFMESHSKMSTKHEVWKKIEWSTKAYVPLDQEEQRIKAQDPRKPVSVVIPVSYAMRQTLLTYMSAAFFGESPLLPYEPQEAGDTPGVAMLEALVDWQRTRMKWELALHTQWSDAFTYGLGVIAPMWQRQIGYRVVRRPVGITDYATGYFLQTGEEKGLEEYLSFEGHRLHAIDPWLYFPDPSAPAHYIEDMEFCGWVVPTNTMSLLSQERSGDGLFNCQYMKHTGDNRSFFLRQGDRDAMDPRPASNPADVGWMYWNLIPSDYNLGDGEYPETWLFGLAGDELVVFAKRVKYAHNRFPVVSCAPDSDGRDALPTSRLEIGYGMQTTVDWLISSHVKNVRKTVNNTIIYDPNIVNAVALQAVGEAGGLVPTRRTTWGRSIKDGVHQLQMTDITVRNVADAEFLMGIMNRTGGTMDAVSGVMQQGGPERLPATESRGVRNAAISRLEHTARLVSIQSMRDLGFILGHQTQQFMSEETALRVLGRTAENLKLESGSYVNVNPFDVLVPFDVVPRDGTIPNPDNADVLMRMYEVIANSPVAQSYDLGGMIAAAARQAGVKNLSDFRIKATVMDDALLQAQVNAGNAIPVSGGTEQ